MIRKILVEFFDLIGLVVLVLWIVFGLYKAVN